MGSVFKREVLNTRDEEPEESPSSLRNPLDAKQVQMRRKNEDAVPSPRPHRIVSRRKVRSVAEPVKVESVELPEPDLPLPDDDPAAGDSKEEESEKDVDIEALKEEWETEWEKRLESATEEARQEGYEAGYESAQEELRAEMEQTQAALQDDVDHLETLWQAYIKESKPLLAQLAIEAAEYILDADLPDAIKGASGRAITQAVENLAGDEQLTITLHPVDHLRLKEAGLTEQLNTNHPELKWQTDASLNEGDWQVQSPEALVRRLRSDLLTTLKQRLSLEDD